MARLGTLDEAVAALRAGGLAAIPTETLWGLCARADDPVALAKVFAAKERPEAVALSLAVPSWASAAQLVAASEGAQALAAKFLPGPATLVCAKAPGQAWLDDVAPGKATVGIRVPDHPVAQQVLRRAPVVAMTSANKHGAPDCRTAEDVLAALDGVECVVVAGGPVTGTGSTVVDTTQPRPKVLREGVIPTKEVEHAWPSSSPTSPSRTG